MKGILFIEDTLENKISYYHIAAFLSTLPFDLLYSQLALISFTVHTVIHLDMERFRNAFRWQVLLLSSVFFVTVVGIAYAPDKAQAFKELEKQVAILLFPVVLTWSNLDVKKYLESFLLLFSSACVMALLYLYFDAVHIIVYNKLSLQTLFTSAFINHNFSAPIGLHATYFAMYCLLAATTIFYFLLNEPGIINRVIFVLCLLILLAGLLQLASRSVLISGVVIALCFPFLLPQKSGRVKLIAIIAGILVIAGILIANISSFKLRYVSQFKNDLTQESMNAEFLEPRVTRWKYILKIIQNSPVTGHGTGSEQKLLNQTYFDNKLYNSYLHELNSHNQYLAFLVETGIWGLIVYLFTLFHGFAAAIRQRSILFMSFMILITIVSFSENILDANKGIFFYACFFSLFMFAGKPFDWSFRFKKRQKPDG